MEGEPPTPAGELPALLMCRSDARSVCSVPSFREPPVSEPTSAWYERNVRTPHLYNRSRPLALDVDFRIVVRVSWSRNPSRLRSSTTPDDTGRWRGI